MTGGDRVKIAYFENPYPLKKESLGIIDRII
jgi:hypothetical protein